jgi:hypothetical protein
LQVAIKEPRIFTLRKKGKIAEGRSFYFFFFFFHCRK